MHLPPLDVAVYPVITKSHAGKPTNTSPATSSTSTPPPSTVSWNAYTAPPDFSSIQKVIRNVFRSPKIQLHHAARLPGRLHQVFVATLADGSSLVLKCPPTYNTRTLRQEKHGLENERKTLETLREYTQLSLPQVIKYDSKGGPSGSQFLMMSHVPGRPLSELSPYLSPSEQQAVDRTLGTYVRTLSSLSATQFGLTHRVFAKKGHSTWREAFLALLEAVLRDGEDMLVTLPYDSIRYYVGRHAAYLDEVTVPHLVALDACEPQNVLLNEKTKQVTGLVGFSNVIWGDPLMSGGISGGSDAFFEGFGGRPSQTGGDVARQLIYTTYRSLVQVVAHYYRPHLEADEMEARRSLTHALNELARA